MAKNRNLSDRGEGTAEELGGKLKKGVGTLLGDDELEVEGRAQERAGHELKEDAKARERVKGKVEEVTGAVKNRVGRILGDDEMAVEGKAREIKGGVRQDANEPDED
jgi:uncharacterized protein YjbJ (UPF0337 family)